MAVTDRRRGHSLLPRIEMSSEGKMKALRIAIALAVLLVCASLGFLAVGRTTMLLTAGVLALIIVVVGILFFSERLHWSLALMMLTAAFTPLSLPTGTNSRIADSMVVTGGFFFLWVLRMFIVEKRFRLVRTSSNLPLLAWMAVAAISLVWSMVFRDKEVVIWNSFPLVQVASTVLMILLPAGFLIVANFAHRPVLLKIITWTLILAGPIGLLSYFTGIWTPVNTGGLFAMWVITLSLGLAFFQPGLGIIVRGLLLAQVAGWVVWSFVLHISWVAGWLPGIVCIGILTFFRSRKLFFSLVLAVVLIVVTFSGYFLQRLEMERAESGDSRVAAWRVNWRVTGQHLLFGTGPGGYAAYYMTYYPNEGVATHNNYVDVIAQSGLVGLVLWLWFFGITAWQGFQLVMRVKGRRDFYEGLANAVFAGTIGCILIMMFGDWLLPFAYTQTILGFDHAIYSWMFMGTIVAMNHILDTQENKEAAALA